MDIYNELPSPITSEGDCIVKTELLKAMDTWDKFGNDPNEGLIRLSTPALQDRYVPYVKYEDMVNYVKGMPLVTPQPCEDAISRQAAVKAVMQDLSDKRTHGFNAGVTRAANIIKLLPPVTPQPRKGHWINTCEYAYRAIDYVECSCCHHKSLEVGNYCPNCGAKTEGNRQWE